MPLSETVLTVSDARRLFGAGRLRWMVASGRWQNPARGVVVLHAGPLSPSEIVRSEVFAPRNGRWVMRIAGFALRREPERVADVLRTFFSRHPRR